MSKSFPLLRFCESIKNMLLIWMKQDKGKRVKSSLKLTHQEMAVSAYYLEMWSSLLEGTAKKVDNSCP